MNFFSRTCPCCIKPIALGKRFKLVKDGDIYCPNCGVRLEPAHVSYWVNVLFSGVIIALIYIFLFKKNDFILILLLLALGNPLQRLLDLFGSLKKLE